MGKRALVVDDSKSARFALKRMLKTLKLEVDTVESAADAINYLQDHLPDVIFMDHMMPGMDGFEAVKRIKNNPQTAIIPIMMYTSKGGDVYLSEARALGAVGIIRKTIAPVELQSSLVELGIIEDIPYVTTLNVDEPVNVKTHQQLAKKITHPEKDSIDTYIKDLHRLIDDQTIELHRSMWLGIESASNEIFNRLNSDFEEKLEKLHTEAQQKVSSKSIFYKNGSWWPAYVISLLLIVSLTFNLFLMSNSKSGPDKKLSDVASATNINNFEIAKAQKTITGINTVKAPVYKKTANEFIRWASDKVIEYPFDEVALNDKRLPHIEDLIEKAIEANFKGRIVLQTHAGVFCLNIDQMGNYQLADKTVSIANCELIGNYIQPNDETTSHQSLGFVNYLSDTELLREQGIAIEVKSLNRRIELSQYPDRSSLITADKWNQAAQLNNRITVMLEPDSFDL